MWHINNFYIILYVDLKASILRFTVLCFNWKTQSVDIRCGIFRSFRVACWFPRLLVRLICQHRFKVIQSNRSIYRTRLLHCKCKSLSKRRPVSLIQGYKCKQNKKHHFTFFADAELLTVQIVTYLVVTLCCLCFLFLFFSFFFFFF